MPRYIAIVYQNTETDFGVSFPDFPGCITVGQSLDEAKVLAREALVLHIQGAIGNDEQLPAPSSLEDIMADSGNADAIAYFSCRCSLR